MIGNRGGAPTAWVAAITAGRPLVGRRQGQVDRLGSRGVVLAGQRGVGRRRDRGQGLALLQRAHQVVRQVGPGN